jgi:hypothetical protein
MSRWLVIILLSLVLSATFTGATYFVAQYETVAFTCASSKVFGATPQNNTYKKSSYGFPESYYHKYSAPESDGCQQPATPEAGTKTDVKSNIIASTQFSKQNLLKDFVAWSVASLLVTTLLFKPGRKNG